MEPSTELELLRFVLQQQGIDYVICDKEWRIEAYSPKFPLLAGSPQSLLGRRPSEIFDEFEGVAAELDAVAQRTLAQFQIPHICHECSDSGSVYLTFTAVAVEPALLLIITDTTQEVQLMQRLMQERNEVILLQQRLAAANGRKGGAPDSPRSEGTEKGIFRQDSQDYQD